MINQSTYARPRGDLAEAILQMNPGMNFLADAILPVRPVALKSATLLALERENAGEPETKHGTGAAYNRVALRAEDITYTCINHGLEAQLPDSQRALYTNDMDAEMETVQDIIMKMKIAREIRVKDAIFNTTTFTGASLYTDNSSYPWDTTTTTIANQVRAAVDKVLTNSGFHPNTLVIGEVALTNILNNTTVDDYFPGAAAITVEMLKGALGSIFNLASGGPGLLVGTAAYNTAKDGQTYSGGFIWPDDYAMICYVNPSSLRYGGLGKTFVWSEMSGELYNVEQYREEQTKSDVFRVEHFAEEKILDAYMGHLLKIDA